MGLLDAFHETWSQARETFGQGTPEDGATFDGSARLLQMKSSVEAAAPDSRWQGTASEAYAAANKEHAQVYGKLADLDKRVAAEVTNAANVVTTGRQNLDHVKSWVTSMAASIPDTTAEERDRKLLPIVNKGVSQLSDIIQKSTNGMTDIRGRVRGLKGEYDALTNQKFAPGEKKPGDQKDDKRLGAKEDGEGEDEKKPEEKSPAETGAADSQALQNGQLTPEQRERLAASTTLDPAQQDALNKGTLQLPPEQMAYLQGFSRAFGEKTPAEIKAIMDKANQANTGDGSRVADAFQLASNSHIKTGEPGTEPPSIDHPASGGKYALPDGVQKVLDGPVLTQDFTSGVFQDGRWIVPQEPTGPLHPTSGLNDLADIIQRGNPSLQAGTALDSGLFAKSQELLDQSNHLPMAQAHAPGGDAAERPRWYHGTVDPTLQNMFNAVNKDDIVVHDAIVGQPEIHPPYGNTTVLTPEGKNFLDNLTEHQWQDDGLAAGGLFDWVGENANQDSSNHAADTAHALAEYTSDNHDRLLNLPGTEGLALGQVNPELTRDWARAFTPYFDDMVNQHDGDSNGTFSPLDPDGTPSPEKTRHLMSVLASDQPPGDKKPGDNIPLSASEIAFNSTKDHVEHAIAQAALSVPDANMGDNEQAVKHAGRLQAAFDLGTYDEADDRLHDEFSAQHSAWELRGKLYDLGTYAIGIQEFPHAGQIKDTLELGKEIFTGTEPVQGHPANVDLPDTYQIDKRIAETLISHNIGDPSIFGDNLVDGKLIPPPQSGDDSFNNYRQQITNYLNSIDNNNPDSTIGFHQLVDEYWKTYAAAVNHGYQQK